MCLKAGAAPFLLLGPMLGHVTETNARIWIKASAPARVEVVVATTPDLEPSRRVEGPGLPPETAAADTIDIPGLEPAHRYFYCVRLDGQPVMSPPYPSFVTAGAAGERGHLRFAFVSCSGYSPHDPAPSWADLSLRTNIDLILQLGDNHYGNSTALAKQREAYLGQRICSSFREATSRIPTYGVWDDHDFAGNDSDSTWPGREEAFQAFREHWANPAYGEPGNPGVYFEFVRGDVHFILLDDRYYRTPNLQTNAPGRTMLGPRQLAWVKERLEGSKSKIKILAAGGEWQSNGSPDSWTSFPAERDEILNFIRTKEIPGVLLISGDRHFTAAYQVQKRFLEVTSGPFGGNPAESRNLPEMLMNHGKGRFYCVYDIDTRQAEPTATLEVYQIGLGLIERRTFTWDEIQGRTAIPPLPPSPSKPVIR